MIVYVQVFVFRVLWNHQSPDRQIASSQCKQTLNQKKHEARRWSRFLRQRSLKDTAGRFLNTPQPLLWMVGVSEDMPELGSCIWLTNWMWRLGNTYSDWVTVTQHCKDSLCVFLGICEEASCRGCSISRETLTPSSGHSYVQIFVKGGKCVAYLLI